MTYTGKVKWNGNHYDAGEVVKGSKIKQEPNGKVFIFDDEPTLYPGFGELSRDSWVEVAQHTVEKDGEKVNFEIVDDSSIPNIEEFRGAQGYELCTRCESVLVPTSLKWTENSCPSLEFGCACGEGTLLCEHCDDKAHQE